MKNKIIIFLSVVLLLVPIQSYDILAEETDKLTDNNLIKVYINNKEIKFNDTYGYPFIDQNKRTQVPFRLTLEKYGAKVTWDGKNRVAKAEKNGIVVKVPVGEKYILKNDEMIINDTKAIINNSRVYLPIRVVMEAFGCTVTWAEKSKSVYIDYDLEGSSGNSLPKTYDLRDINKVSPVKDQGTFGTCWAFASLGAIESSLLPQGVYDFSEDHMSLTHGYKVDQADGGDFNIAMAYFSRWSGPVFEKDDPYGDGIASKTAKARKHIQEAIMLPSKDYQAIKTAVLTYGGVQSALYINEDLELGNTVFNPETNAYYYNGKKGRNHDVVVVGWDDTYPKENFITQPLKNGAFIAKNSYGTGFGDEGYFFISYEDVHIGTNNVVYTRIDPVSNYDQIYQTDWLGWIGRLGYGSDTAYFSNIYEAKQKEALSAVSFYATGPNTTYEVYIVEDFQDTNDFKNMKLLKRGSFEYKGYYTVDIDQPIEVNGRFAVIVKVKTPGSKLPVAAEYYKDVSWLDQVNINDGEGYMSLTGTVWDSTEKLLNSNVCLKAFTNIIE